MSTFSCPVVRVASVEDHPNADRLSLVRLEGLGYLCISGKLEDGSPRYRAGDWCVYIPSAAVLPEWLLKEMDFWDEEKGKGTLAGSDGNRVKPLRLRGIFSEGVLYPLNAYGEDEFLTNDPAKAVCWFVEAPIGENEVNLGDDTSSFLGITKYTPPIPVHMAGEVANVSEAATNYDFERWESVPDIFDENIRVNAVEKAHGCLHADSLVMLPNGEQVTISEIVAGNYSHVLSYDITNNTYITRPITGRMRRPNTENKTWVKLIIENGKTLTLTEDHPVYSRDRKDWIAAGDINSGEDIESPIM